MRKLPFYNLKAPHFTKRQMQVLKLTALGLSVKEIAAELCLSRKTIEKYRNVLNRLGFHDIVTLTHFALARGLVSNLYSSESTN
jgi:DNA-binding NarL/FixJ family response regulator